VRAYFELLRPANVVTALADVLAGVAVAGVRDHGDLPWLLGSTACLYAGGVVLNDFFDRDLDRVERPERPIPSGRVAASHAAAFGVGLLCAGVLCAFQATPTSGLVAITIAAAVILYDSWGKRHAAVAPANMGLCRALNLALGIAAAPDVLQTAWPLTAIPFVYIAAITTLSRGEVYGGGQRAGTVALILLILSCGGLMSVAARSGAHWLPAVALAAALAMRVVPAFWIARRAPTPAAIRAAVKRGVLMLVVLDATIGAAYAGPIFAALILATGLAAAWLARLFAVT
jgi:4-hydroxybenzoate polyprenyltransferase